MSVGTRRWLRDESGGAFVDKEDAIGGVHKSSVESLTDRGLVLATAKLVDEGGNGKENGVLNVDMHKALHQGNVSTAITMQSQQSTEEFADVDLDLVEERKRRRACPTEEAHCKSMDVDGVQKSTLQVKGMVQPKSMDVDVQTTSTTLVSGDEEDASISKNLVLAGSKACQDS
ncbi:hypothetical protein PTKIN_Ptkin03bG0193800 [Pterospermum kingtungense]